MIFLIINYGLPTGLLWFLFYVHLTLESLTMWLIWYKLHTAHNPMICPVKATTLSLLFVYDWLIDWLIEWVSEWVSEWVIDGLIDRLIIWMTGWLTYCLIAFWPCWEFCWLTDLCLTNLMTLESFIHRLTDWLIDWLTFYLTTWLIEKLTEYLWGWLADSVTRWLT